MSKLLVNRLAVLRRQRLKEHFLSTLVFALRDANRISPERIENFVRGIKNGSVISFADLEMDKTDVQQWLDALCDELCLSNHIGMFQKHMKKALEMEHVCLGEIWYACVKLYSQTLLCDGAKIIKSKKNGFSLDKVCYLIANPEEIQGIETFNSVPPMLENNYFYIHIGGINQQTDWHRGIFLCSYLEALLSYQKDLTLSKIKQKFSA